MNYTEKYEVRWRSEYGAWKLLDTFPSESKAVEAMELDTRIATGSWEVVRVSEVQIAHRFKA